MADASMAASIIFSVTDNTLPGIGSIRSGLNEFESSVGNVTQPLADLTTGLLKTEAAVIALAAAYGGFALSKSIEFENAQIDLAKVLDETDPKIESFTKTVIDLSEQYGISAASILQGIANFKQAGFTAEESAKLQKDALDLVIAGDLDAARASEVLISSLKGFGAVADDATRFIEALNNVSNKYATDLGELSAGMSGISPIAKQMGFSFEETTGLITPVIEVFRSGEQASIALKTGLLRLIDDSKPVGDALEKIGISQLDLNGNMRSGKDIFYDVAGAFQNLDEKQKLVVTSQLVGIDQAAKMVTVFDNLGKVQNITAEAMKVTGSVTEEVALKLASAGGGVKQLTEVFNNLAVSVGDELKPAFNDAVNGTKTLLQAFRDVVDAGGLGDLFDNIDVQGADFKAFLEGIAQALPDAFNGVNFDELVKSFGNLKGSIADLFGGLDLTKPEDLEKALQNLVNFLTLMTNASSGAVDGLKPLIDATTSFLNSLASGDPSFQSMIGNIGGLATSINAVLPALGFLADTLILIGGIRSFAGLSGLSTAVSGASTALAAASITGASFVATSGALAAAGLAAGYGIGTVLQDAIKTVTGSSQTLGESIGGLAYDFKEWLDGNPTAAALNDIAYASKELEQSISPVAEAFSNQLTAQELAAESMEKYGTLTGRTKEEINSMLDSVYGMGEVIHDGAVSTNDGTDALAAYGVSATESVKPLKNAALATGELTQSEKIAIQNSYEMEKVLVQLASNEKIKAMEFTAEIKVADIQGQAQQVVAAYDAIGVSVSSTNSLISDLFSHEAPKWDNFGFDTQRAADDANNRADELNASQIAMNNSQIENLNARTRQLNNGGSEININADSLAPELQQVLRSLIDNIRIEAVNNGLEILQ